MKTVSIQKIKLNNFSKFVFIGGPDVIESERHALMMAGKMKAITNKLRIPFVFKCSYDKANRTSIAAYRGPGLTKAMPVYQKIKDTLNIPITADVHTSEEATAAGRILDMIQIPALLSRQTDLVVAAARTGKPVNIKKGQFSAPDDIPGIIGKIESQKNTKCVFTERGVMFGYHNLIVDMRSLEIMKKFGYPVIFDAGHSVQLPGGHGASSGGQREFIAPLSRAAIAVGIAGIFLEVHDNPDKALVDGPNSMPLKELESYLKMLKKIDDVVKR